MSNCGGVSDKILIGLLRRMPNLSSVILAQTHVTEAVLQCLYRTCRDIRELDLSMSNVALEGLPKVRWWLFLPLSPSDMCILMERFFPSVVGTWLSSSWLRAGLYAQERFLRSWNWFPIWNTCS